MIKLALRLVLLLIVSLGCSNLPSPQVVKAERAKAELIYASSDLAVSRATELVRAYEMVRPSPSDSERAVLARLNENLARARAALNVVRPWLDTGENEPAARSAMRDGAKAFRLALDDLAKIGPVPKQIERALRSVEDALKAET